MSEDLFQYEVINGENLSAKALANLHKIGDVLSEFFDISACVFVKNGFVFSTALGKNSNEAYLKAFDSDPLSSFSACVGFSTAVDAETAKHLQSYAIPLIAAPEFDEGAIDILTEDGNSILVKFKTPLKNYKSFEQEKILRTPFGEICTETRNKLELDKNTFKVVTKTKPATEAIEDAIFAWKISKYLAPLSVVVAKDFKTSAIIQATANSQVAVETALNFSCDNSKNSVLCLSDDLLTEGVLHAAIQGRISTIIYSGGEYNNIKINALADKYEIAILTTGIKL